MSGPCLAIMTSFVALSQVGPIIGISTVLSGGILAVIMKPVENIRTGTSILCSLLTHISLSAQSRSFPPHVWLEGAKERTDLLREIFGPPIKRVFKLSGTPGEGEGAVFRDGLTGRDGDSVPGLIQRRPEIACDITNRLGER